MQLFLNGNSRTFEQLVDGAMLDALVQVLGFRADRLAIERNGQIVPRSSWAQTSLHEGDRLEVVHFVGGGTPRA